MLQSETHTYISSRQAPSLCSLGLSQTAVLTMGTFCSLIKCFSEQLGYSAVGILPRAEDTKSIKHNTGPPVICGTWGTNK